MTLGRRSFLTAAAFFLTLLPQSFAAETARRPVAAEVWVRTELYFGLSIPSGPHEAPARQVSDEDWQRFVDEEISTRFPDGLTIHHVGGQWRSRPSDGHPVEIVHEDSRVVVIIHRENAVTLGELDGARSADDEKIEAIRDAYKLRFHQDSVLRTDATLRVSF